MKLRATAGCVGTLVNQATVTMPAGLIDPPRANNVLHATVTVPVSTNLSNGKNNVVTSVPSVSTTNHSITVSNNGPASVDNRVLSDAAGPRLSFTAVSCSASGGVVCPASQTDATLQDSRLNLAILPASSAPVFTPVCRITASGC